MTPPWSPYDFILNGEFADPEFLRDAVEHVRSKTESTCCVLIVHQAGELFQSLMYVRHQDSALEASLQKGLSGYHLDREDREGIESLLRQSREDCLSRMLGNLARRLFAGFRDSFDDLPSRMEVSQQECRLRAAGPSAARVGVLCIGARRPIPAPLMDELTVAVHASAPVYLHRVGKSQEAKRGPFKKLSGVIREHFGISTAEAVRGATNPAQAAGDLAPLERFLQEVLESVGATQGTVYMIGDSPAQLVPVARLGPGNSSRYVAFSGNSVEVKKGGGVVSEVKRQRRPILYNGLLNFKQMVPKIGHIPFSRDDPEIRSDAALAVPIIDKSKADYPVIGVLITEKSLEHAETWATQRSQTHAKSQAQTYQNDNWKRPFTLHEVAFLQEAADRLVAAWIGGWNEALNRIVQSTKRHLRPYKVRPSEFGYAPRDNSTKLNLPADFAAIEGMLRDMLVPFCETISLIKACTVRVLSVDQSKLDLLLKYPADLKDVPIEVNLQDDNPIAKVVVSGTSRSGPVDGLPTPVEGLESYACLPLFIESRCVGAVTFASAFPSTFLTQLSEAFAAATETVAAAIEFAQTQALASILGSTIQLFRTIHEINKIPEGSKQYLDRAASALAKRPPDCEAISDALEKARADMRLLDDCLTRYVEARRPRAVAALAHNRPYSVRALIVELLRIEESHDVFKIRDDPWPGQVALAQDEDRVDSRVYEVCLDAMSDLIRNARHQMSSARRSDGQIYLHRRQLGGRTYACISLQNRRLLELSTSLLACLYREPVRKPEDDRLHYGAFLAAWLVRSVGGDVHITCEPDETFSVTVEIPLLTPKEITPSLE